MLTLYQILYSIFVLCYLPFFLIRGKWHRGFLMRFGILPEKVIKKIKDKRVIWLHTVSVGEAIAASTLIKKINVEYPQFELLISTVTKTGNRVAQSIAGARNAVIYFPLDLDFIVSRVIGIIKPEIFIIAETEIWPCAISAMAKMNIPVVLINGRLSVNSFKRYQLVRPFIKNILQDFSLLCMQSQDDALRIISLGAAQDKVKVTGNSKFDLEKNGSTPAASLGLSQKEKLFIAGSTHRGEEEIILQTYCKLIKIYPDLRLLIAPRHIERAARVEHLVKKFGFKPQLVSKIGLSAASAEHRTAPVLILDSIGRLKSIYALAELVFIGGSLIAHGGQNPIEPALFFKPVVFGPYMFNFSEVAKIFTSQKAAIQVDDAQQLERSCIAILGDQALQKELGARAAAVLEMNKGASAKNIELIIQLLSLRS